MPNIQPGETSAREGKSSRTGIYTDTKDPLSQDTKSKYPGHPSFISIYDFLWAQIEHECSGKLFGLLLARSKDLVYLSHHRSPRVQVVHTLVVAKNFNQCLCIAARIVFRCQYNFPRNLYPRSCLWYSAALRSENYPRSTP